METSSPGLRPIPQLQDQHYCPSGLLANRIVVTAVSGVLRVTIALSAVATTRVGSGPSCPLLRRSKEAFPDTLAMRPFESWFCSAFSYRSGC